MANMDKHGNLEGTVYTEAGIASHPTNKTAKLKNLPQSEEKPILYNEDGSVFEVPADADKISGQLKTDIAAAQLAITKGNTKVGTLTEMAADADEADKVVFEKNINSQKIAIESNTKVKADLEAKLKEFTLSLITPKQRADQRLLDSLLADKAALQVKIDAQLEVMKQYNVAGLKADAVINPEATPEHAIMVAKYGSQGKAIVALVKEGKTNTEIYKYLGIPPASVPGPKNAFRKSDEGKKYKWNTEGNCIGLL